MLNKQRSRVGGSWEVPVGFDELLSGNPWKIQIF